MTTHIALLRGVNLAGHKPVAMADLREVCAGLGFRKVRTVLQSGNVVFESTGKAAGSLERLLEAETKKRLGVATTCAIRTAAEWDKVVARNPFPKEAEQDPGRLVVIFLRAAPSVGALKALESAIVGREVVQAVGKQTYVYYPDGQGRSKLTFAILDKHLGAGATGRNWNTVMRLAVLAGAA